MKKLAFLVLFSIIFSFTATSQIIDSRDPFPNTNKVLMDSNFDPYIIAGLIKFDSKEAAKKVKVRKKDAKKQFIKRLESYNKSVSGLSRINSFFLDDLKKNYDKIYKDAIDAKNFRPLQSYQKEVLKTIRPIKFQSLKLDSLLTVDLKNILTEKEFSKWIKYSNKEKTKAIPTRTRAPVRTINRNRQRRF